MGSQTQVHEEPLADPRLDADIEVPDILAYQQAVQILERVRGIVDATTTSTLERTTEFIRGIMPVSVTTVESPADVTLALLENAGIAPESVRLVLPPAMEDLPPSMIAGYRCWSSVHTSARALWAFDALLFNAIQLINRRQPAAPGPYVDLEFALPEDVLLTHRSDERSALRVRAGKLGCAAIFQFAADLNSAEEQACGATGNPTTRTAATLGALAARSEPGAACGVRRVSLFGRKPPLRGALDVKRTWLPEAVAQAAAVLEATRSKEVPFCVTDGVWWLAGYVAREEGGGVRCRCASPRPIGEDMLSLGWTATEEEQESSFRAVLALMCALVDEDVQLAELFS